MLKHTTISYTHFCYILTSSSSFNGSKILTDSASSLKFSIGPTVAARTGLPMTVVSEEFVPRGICVSFLPGKSTPLL